MTHGGHYNVPTHLANAAKPVQTAPYEPSGLPHMNERATAKSLVVRRLLQPIWRLQRSLTLGAQGIVLDADGRVLLVKHTYKPGWCFPGGGVEKGETVVTALTREMHEECGVEIAGTPELFGVYSNCRAFPNDHVVLYVIRQWRRTHVPAPNSEIAAQDFFVPAPLPSDTAPATARRLTELLSGGPRDDYW